MANWQAIVSNLLLFTLVWGMSATVDVLHLKEQLHNRRAILSGLFLQFFILPFCGYVVIKILNLSSTIGVTLLVVVSSPGGSYSNWWCSLFNADLALSVAMTTMSTIISLGMLPFNVFVYTTAAYGGGGDSIIQTLNWGGMMISVGIVIGAISLGIFCSWRVDSIVFNQYANRAGNVAGVALIVFSFCIAVFGGGSSGGDSSADNTTDTSYADAEGQTWQFFIGVALPCVLGLLVANILTSTCVNLKKPERVTQSVECCYQNTGIATSVAITMFTGQEQQIALLVPLYYGIVEAVVLGIYCIIAWKIGWTKAPANENFCVMLGKSYEVEEAIELRSTMLRRSAMLEGSEMLELQKEENQMQKMEDETQQKEDDANGKEMNGSADVENPQNILTGAGVDGAEDNARKETGETQEDVESATGNDEGVEVKIISQPISTEEGESSEQAVTVKTQSMIVGETNPSRD